MFQNFENGAEMPLTSKTTKKFCKIFYDGSEDIFFFEKYKNRAKLFSTKKRVQTMIFGGGVNI